MTMGDDVPIARFTPCAMGKAEDLSDVLLHL